MGIFNPNKIGTIVTEKAGLSLMDKLAFSF